MCIFYGELVIFATVTKYVLGIPHSIFNFYQQINIITQPHISS